MLPASRTFAGLTCQVEILVHDEDDTPLPCRIHLLDEDGNPQQARELPFWRDHFVCPGRVKVELEPGRYEMTVERGPEYAPVERVIEVRDETEQQIAVLLSRIAELRQSGWYSADLHVHRPPDEVELLMRAEDLDFAPVITWWNQRNLWQDRDPPEQPLHRFDGHRLIHWMAGEDEREGGALLYFGLNRPLDIATPSREVPSPLQFVEQALHENPDVWIDIEKPFWWDVPAWLASGKVHSIGLANNHMWRSGMLAGEAWGRARDKNRLPDPLGNALWTQEIYYHVLNAGLRIPPSAGSASGVLPNPVGYNRVYVHCENGFSHDRWWRGLAEGRCLVTNGPLLVCRANGEFPGHTFSASGDDGPLRIRLSIELTSNDHVPQMEVVANGRVVKRIPGSGKTSQTHEVDLSLAESGWFLIRAVADNATTYRFGSTGPFYVQLDKKPEHISRSSCEFFLNWTEERMARVVENIESEQDRQVVLGYHENARAYWMQQRARATAP